MMTDERWRFSRYDVYVLIFFVLVATWTFRLVLAGTHEPIMSSMREFEPWKSTLTRVDLDRNESFADDPTTQSYPWTHYAHEQMHEGDFPLWNMRMFSGTPFTANRLTGLYNPLVLIPAYLLPTIPALTAMYFMHYVMAAWFMYLFLKSMGISRSAACFGAAAFILQGSYIPWMGIIVLDKAYFVMGLYYLQRLMARTDACGYFGFVLSYYFMITASYPQLVIVGLYTYIFWILFSVKWSAKNAMRRGLGLFLMMLTVFFLGGMQNIPMLEFYQNSLRSLPEFKEELASLTKLESFEGPANYVVIFFPKFFGDYLGVQINNLPEFVLGILNHAYIGILSAFGFLLCPMVWKNRYARFFIVYVLIGLMFIGWHQSYLFALKILPGMRISTVKPYFPTLLSMIIVSTFVLDVFLKRLPTDKKFAAKFLRAYGWVLGAVLGMSMVIYITRLLPGVLPLSDLYQYMQVFSGLIFIWVMGAVFYLHVRRGLKNHFVVASMLILLLINMLPYKEHFMPLVEKGRVCYPTPGIEFLAAKMEDEGPFRFFRDRRIMFPPNTPMLYDLDEPGGFDSFVSKDYGLFFRSLDNQMNRNSRMLDLPENQANYRQPFWQFLGIRYIITPGEMPYLPDYWKPVFNEEMLIYENTKALPRWFLVPSVVRVDTIQQGYVEAQRIDPEYIAVVEDLPEEKFPDGSGEWVSDPIDGKVELLEYTADRVKLNVTSDKDAFLVFSDVYYPGWRAWVDGEETDVYRTDGIIKGIVVPGGEYEVRFLYDPISYKIGWVISLIGLILAVWFRKPAIRLFSSGDY
jgi:hypothetical protein